jgi:hypothetical protein
MALPVTWDKTNIMHSVYGNTLADDILYTIIQIFFTNSFGVQDQNYLAFLVGSMWRNYNETFRDLLITFLNIGWHFSQGTGIILTPFDVVGNYPNSVDDLLLMVDGKINSILRHVDGLPSIVTPALHPSDISNHFPDRVDDILLDTLNRIRAFDNLAPIAPYDYPQLCNMTREDILFAILNTINYRFTSKKLLTEAGQFILIDSDTNEDGWNLNFD